MRTSLNDFFTINLISLPGTFYIHKHTVANTLRHANSIVLIVKVENRTKMNEPILIRINNGG